MRFGIAVLLFEITVIVAGCGKPTSLYDPAAIASEADHGNLKPLQEVNAACDQEVAAAEPRKVACAALNRAVSLRTPVDPWKK